MAKLRLKPSASHPITIEPFKGRFTVKVDGKTIATSERALLLKEASYPPAVYVPRSDVKMDLLERSTNETYCPYKGEASYFSIPSGGKRTEDAVWTYEAPYESVAEIKDHLAFYTDRVEISTN